VLRDPGAEECRGFSAREIAQRSSGRGHKQDITASILTQALDIKAKHGFSYWDSAIIAAARALGCQQLYSEDMAHRRDVEGVVILNPFR